MAWWILELRHWTPYDGCSWEWNYWLVEHTRNGVGEFLPVYYVNLRRHETGSSTTTMNQALLKAAYRAARKDEDWESPEGYFDKASVYQYNRTVMENIPLGRWPHFRDVFNEVGLQFLWQCEDCKEWLDGDEELPDDYDWRGNEGVGIEIEGWICTDCVNIRKNESRRHDIERNTDISLIEQFKPRYMETWIEEIDSCFRERDDIPWCVDDDEIEDVILDCRLLLPQQSRIVHRPWVFPTYQCAFLRYRRKPIWRKIPFENPIKRIRRKEDETWEVSSIGTA